MSLKEELNRYRKWVSANAIGRAVAGFLPSFIDKDSRDLSVVVTDDMQPRTDGRTIWVSLLPDALDPKFTAEEWLIILQAATCHEAQHVNSSNFDDITEICAWYGKYLEKRRPGSKGIGENLAKDYLNIVEDGRIESIAVKRRPGMREHFIYMNAMLREGAAIKKAAKEPAAEYGDFQNTCLVYAKTGLLPPGIKAYAGSEMEKAFQRARPFIDEGVNARTSEDCRLAVEKLLKAVTPYLLDLIQNQALQDKLQQNQQQQPEYSSNGERDYNDPQPGSGNGNPLRAPQSQPTSSSSQQDPDDSSGSDSSNGKEKKEKGKGKGKKKENAKDDASGADSGKDSDTDSDQKAGNKDSDKPDDSDDASDEKDSEKSGDADKKDDGETDDAGEKGKKNKKGDGDGSEPDSEGNSSKNDSESTRNQESPMGFADEPCERSALTQEELDGLRRLADSAINAAKAAEAAENQPPLNDGLKSTELGKVLSAYGHRTYAVNMTALPINGNEPIPATLTAEALQLRRDIQRILTERRKEQRGLRRGNLDTRNLWKVGVGDNTIFTKRRDPKAGSAAFYVLIDNSGSTMSEAYYKDHQEVRKYEAERMAAAVIEHAAIGLVPTKIVLFDQDSGAVNHEIIRTFDDSKRQNRSWNSLTVRGPGGCNADSVHIRIAAEELAKRREQKKILFLLSDGMPSAYGSRNAAESEVNKAVVDARRKGVIVIPIMFGELDFLRSSYSKYERMYEKNIIACHPEEITAKLSQLFRQIIAR